MFLFLPVLLCLVSVPSAHALDEFPFDLRLVRQLSQIEMFDYAMRQFEIMLAKHPDRKELILIEQSRVLFLTGKAPQGEAALKQIAPASPNYPAACLVLAEMSMRRGDNATAKKAFADFFAKRPAPASEGEDDVEEFRRAVLQYSGVLKHEGDGPGAARVMDYLAKIKGADGASDRQLMFLKGQAVLAALDKAVDEGKPVDVKTVQDTVKLLEGVQWGGVDAVTAAALVETAHGYILLKNYDRAIQTLKSGAEIMTQVEEILKEERNLDASPMAGAHLFLGMAQVGQANALKAKDRAAAEKNLIEALKRFQLVRQNYPKSQYVLRATVEFAKAKSLLEKEFGRKVATAGGADDANLELQVQQAEALLKVKKYAEALPLYLEAVRIGRRSPRLPPVAASLVQCYANLGKIHEAQAIAYHLSDQFPADSDTADTLLRLGAVVFQQANDPKLATDAKERQLALAMEIWDRFVTVAPTNSKAPDVAFMVAENGYRVASELAAAVKPLPDGAAKEEAKRKARAAYLAAAPKYQRVIDLFPAHEKGIRSYYKLGWIYDATNEPQKAAEAFLKYSELESNPKLNNDCLEAKFRAADQLMSGDTAAESVSHYKELLTWLEPGNTRGFDPNTPTAKRLREDAMGYLGWAYDLAAETFRPRLTAIDDRLAEAKARLQQIEVNRQRAAASVEDAAGELVKAQKEYQETEKALSAVPGAEELAKAAGEKTEGKSAAEVETIRKQTEELQRRIGAEIAKRERERLAGEQLDYQTQRQSIQAARQTATERRDKLKLQENGLAADVKTLTQTATGEATELEKAAGKLQEAQKLLVAAQAEQKKWQDALEEAKKQQQAQDPADRQKGTAARAAAAEAVQQADRAAREAKAAVDELTSPAREKQRSERQAGLERVQAQLALKTASLSDLQQELGLEEKNVELLDARLMAVAKGISRNELAQKLLATKSPQDVAADPEMKKAIEAELDGFKQVMTRRIERANLIQEAARRELAAVAKAVAETTQMARQIEEEKGPVHQQLEQFKKLAEAQFRQFLKEYPKSKQVPDSLARLGTILLEFNRYDESAQLLNDLSTRFPESKAAKQAPFNLGRAQLEFGQTEKAAAAFERLLGQIKEQSANNLNYISDKMLAAGQPRISLAATRELLARSENKQHPDYTLCRERLRENLLFRAGAAALALKDAKSALDHFQTLLVENPRTGYYYDAKFALGQTKRQLTPPDFAGALTDFNEILQYATEPAITNRALCEAAETLAGTGGQENLRLAAARYQQVVMLADPSLKELLPFVEQAVFESAKLFARLGEADNRDKMVKKYRDLFPQGRYVNDIGRLPSAEFTPAAPPASPPAPTGK